MKREENFSDALSIVKRLTEAGYVAYFAGGWVRDYVMGQVSTDIDIATNASPERIIELFPGTLLVGLAFGVVIVSINGRQFEVATFRKDSKYQDGRHPEQVDLTADPEEDSRRRDFTINGLFYDPIENKIYDYVNGREDIQKRVVRTIGNPHERFFEDRLRVVRAFRFAARFDFTIDSRTQDAIREHADRLFPAVAIERIWQEFNKMASYPGFDRALIEMHRLGVLRVVFPELEEIGLNDLSQRVRAYPFFPANCPTLLYLMELFPSFSLERKIGISQRLKAPNREIKRVEFVDRLTRAVDRERTERPNTAYEWACLFACPDYRLGIQVIVARLPESERGAFIAYYDHYEHKLKPHIKRIQEGDPLISSQDLLRLGVEPGKRMGVLLKEAQKIAVDYNYHQKELVLNQLMKTDRWSLNL